MDQLENESKISKYIFVNFQYRLDKVLFKFLLDNEMKVGQFPLFQSILYIQLNNSFIFIMGDHGLRFGGVRWTKPGEIEDNNPAFFLVLPAHLRYNDNLVNNLRHNSRQLITHFDIHATLVNIARVKLILNRFINHFLINSANQYDRPYPIP